MEHPDNSGQESGKKGLTELLHWISNLGVVTDELDLGTVIQGSYRHRMALRIVIYTCDSVRPFFQQGGALSLVP